MKFIKEKSEIFVPDNTEAAKALKRTTHMAVAAHQDDIEIMAFKGVLETFNEKDKHFTAIVSTDGAGSARAGKYAGYTDEDMKNVRRLEQKNAALVGGYGALVLLDYSSKEVKDKENKNFEKDLAAVFELARPKIVYTHNLADKHDSHVAVAVKTIKALRRLSPETLPEKVYGCEVWRSLDWMPDEEKIALDVSGNDSLSLALLGIFDSQIAGGKRYDLATDGRRRANATYFASHSVDNAEKLTFAMDLTPLVLDKTADITDYVLSFIEATKKDISGKLKSML